MGWIRRRPSRRPNRTWSKTILESPVLERAHMSTTTELSHAAQDICELWSCITSNIHTYIHDNKSGCLLIRRTSILQAIKTSESFNILYVPFFGVVHLRLSSQKKGNILSVQCQRKEHTSRASTLSSFSYQP
jgi:hypothetical protein